MNLIDKNEYQKRLFLLASIEEAFDKVKKLILDFDESDWQDLEQADYSLWNIAEKDK